MASLNKNDSFHPLASRALPDTTYPDFNPLCSVVGFHVTGTWCPHCRRLGMPWGDTLPVVTSDDDDEEDSIAPQNSLLEGVNIHDPAEVNIVALVADVGLWNGTRPNLLVQAATLTNFDVLERAGRRLELLTGRLQATRGFIWQQLSMGEVLQRALLEPSYTADQLFDFIRTICNYLLPGAELPPVLNEPERPIPNKTKGNDYIDFDKEYIINPDYDKFETPKHKNLPTRQGEWQFLEGQDLSNAQVGKPQPSKFFIAREKVGGKVEDKDIRYFVRWKYFDWQDPLHIERLNKWMHQLSYRTLGSERAVGNRWTAWEKDELICQVAHQLSLKPATRAQMWPKVFEGMIRVFGKTMQKRGDPLAISTKLKDNGDIVKITVKPGVLDDDRFGWNRELKTLINKSDDFGEVNKLLLDYFKDVKRRHGGNAEEQEDCEGADKAKDVAPESEKVQNRPAKRQRISADDKELTESEDKTEKSKTKPKPKIMLVLKLGSDPSNGRPGPPPPPPGTGGADFTGAINHSSAVSAH